jgi:hypothetical protein
MSAGAMELDYTLTGAADAVLTPDFRLQLISPGTFHLAISVGATGDTCVRSLPGNDAAVFVAEMMGRDSYQLSPQKSVLFGGGKISGATAAPERCGCPEPARMPEVAAIPAAEPIAQPLTQPVTQPLTPTRPAEKLAEAAAEQTGVAHLESNSQFVYRGEQTEPDLDGPVSRLTISTDNSALALALLPQVSGPQAPPPVVQKSGFLHWLRHVFGR